MIAALVFLIAAANVDCSQGTIAGDACGTAVEAAKPASPHRVFILDQVSFSVPKDPSTLKVLEPDHSMHAVVVHLKEMHIAFVRGQVSLREDDAPPEFVKLIEQQPGEPIVIPDRGQMTVNVVIDTQLADAPEGRSHG